MAIEYRFTCGLRNGMHARPASMISETARRFQAAVTLGKGAGTPVDARSVLSVVGLDIRCGDPCLVAADGVDGAGAIAAIKELIETRLATGDEVESTGDHGPVGARLPRAWKDSGVAHAGGRAVSGGVGEGLAVMVEGLALSSELAEARAGSLNAELEHARRAVEAVRADLERRSGIVHGTERELLRAHAEIADDPALWQQIEAEIGGGRTAPQAMVAAAESFSSRLRLATSQYIRDRVVDVQDVAMQVLNRLVTGGVAAMNVRLSGASVVFAETLTANQFLQLDRALLKGLVLGHVGATSHTVILARSHRIPTVIDVENPCSLVRAGERVVVDGDGGFVVTQVVPRVSRYYERELRTRDRWFARLEPDAARPAVTSDGAPLEVAANASTAEEVKAAVKNGADGVGLLRTELLFLDRETAPSEDEQFERYSAVVRAAAGRPVIIRTFDIGGDKPATYLHMVREENPFLGVRGLRLYPRYEGMLRTQLRAIVRASVGGNVRVMAPMVATPGEAAWFREEVRKAQSELAGEGVAFDPSMPVGVMVEIPAVSMAIDQIAMHVEFFSIGTNDLCQYWMAVDRGNAGVADLYNPRQPSFLRLLKTVVDGAKARQKWIGVCGEMAGDRDNLPLMIGLGVDEISVAPGGAVGLKAAVREADATMCRQLLESAMSARSADDVDSLLRSMNWRRPSATTIVDRDLIEVESDAADKAEAIKEAVDLLFIAGRTERPRDVEDAVWDREATYSTGLGYGIAVPHCKTVAVSDPGLAVLKLRTPADWGSMDGEPVRVVLLLAVPASEAAGGGGAGHMKIFAKLARKLMHEEFRDRLLSASDPRAIESCMREELGTG